MIYGVKHAQCMFNPCPTGLHLSRAALKRMGHRCLWCRQHIFIWEEPLLGSAVLDDELSPDGKEHLPEPQ